MNKTNIEWCDYTWNPVTGCKRRCKYCYARRIHQRFNKSPFDQIVWHSDRKNDPIKIKHASTIFVGSMSDPEYWDVGMIEYILDVCSNCRQHTFMFLSKEARSYSKWKKIPSNVMCGLTVEKADNALLMNYLRFHSQFNHRPFISLEPMLGRCFRPLPKFEKIIVGAMTGPKPQHPTKAMVESVIENANGNKIFWKDNIRKLFPDLCINKL